MFHLIFLNTRPDMPKSPSARKAKKWRAYYVLDVMACIKKAIPPTEKTGFYPKVKQSKVETFLWGAVPTRRAALAKLRLIKKLLAE